jgi:16S rRNA (guanine527-N7)-methyltransferase
VVDVGAGAGFPGLVAAAVSPDTQVHLVESNRRRVAFLELAAREMGLGNVDVYALRAEEAGRGPLRETAQLVLARAVAPLRTLLEYAGPLCRPGGLLGFPKGTSAEIEIREAANACSELGIEFVERKKMRTEVSWTPWVVIFRKSGSTPDGYPRRSGVPGARPL